MSTPTADEIKSCCAAAYSSPAARFLLGGSFHPGGAALTSELARALRVGPGDTVVDVACGPGTSARQLVRETGCDVIGIDLSPPPQPTDEPRLRFAMGDAEALPLADASVDGALCECALCTFPDKRSAAAEFARVLRPGARLALSDLTARTGELPESLSSLHAWVACIADARPLDELAGLLGDAGLVVEQTEAHDDALKALLDQLEARLKVAALIFPGPAAQGRELIAAAHDELKRGHLGYGVVIARAS